MLVLNKIYKFFGYIGIGIVTLISSYIIAFAFMCIPVSLFCSLWCCFRPLPQVLAEKYGVVLLCLSLLPAFIIFIYTLKNTFSK